MPTLGSNPSISARSWFEGLLLLLVPGAGQVDTASAAEGIQFVDE